MPPVVLVAPAAYKGSFGPRQVADALAAGVRRAMPEAVVLNCPMADGGDGLLDAVLLPGSLRETVQVTGPLGAATPAELGWIDHETAIFASASACGLALLDPTERDPLHATTLGVGELIFEAIDRGARTVIVGLGGTATVDGGAGAARGLGWSLLDKEGRLLPEGGAALVGLATIEGRWRYDAQVIALTDVTTVLGDAARIFGPQKGATPEMVELLDAALGQLAQTWGRMGHAELAALPGGGAAGGLGAGLVFFAHARLAPGAEWVFDRVGFDAALARADLVITGEGTFDDTSMAGKAAGEVVRRARTARKRVAVVAAQQSVLPGIHTVTGDGQRVELDGITALGERAAREAFGLPQG